MKVVDKSIVQLKQLNSLKDGDCFSTDARGPYDNNMDYQFVWIKTQARRGLNGDLIGCVRFSDGYLTYFSQNLYVKFIEYIEVVINPYIMEVS